MPTFTEIAGQNVISLSPREAFLRHLTRDDTVRGEHEQRLTEIVNELGIDDTTDFNQLPVLTYGEKYVLPLGGTFSDRELKVAMKLGHIICDPEPNPVHGARINGSSVDVTMGHYFYAAGNNNVGGIFNPFDQADTYRYFNVKDPETDYKEAKPWAEVKRKLGDRAIKNLEDIDHLQGIPENHPMVLLRPNERILAHTHEFIGILPPGTTSMQARSTTGRIGLSACYCAGWGDPGYINRWTMEIHNLNEDEYLPVPVGYRIAQVVFSMTGSVDTEYSKATGNYQATNSHDLAATKRAWRPHFVLPKAYNSEIILPTPVNGLAEGLK